MRCGVCCCCGIRSPKNWRNIGSSIKGYCWAERARSVDLMVTTAGETRLTRSAYEVPIPEFETAGAGGSLGLRLARPLCALTRANENTITARLKRMFTRDLAPA